MSEAWNPFAGGEIERSVPATEPQLEIWLAVALGGEAANLAYNEVVALDVPGPVDEPALAAALRTLVGRHESLRATFSKDGTQMLIGADARYGFVVDDLATIAETERAAKLAAALRAEVTTPFDLELGPLFRARLVRLGPARNQIVLSAHHIVCDGWSTGVLLTELGALYEAARAGRAATLPPAPRFSDFAVAERAAAATPELADSERHWLAVLGATPAALDLPTDRPRPAERTFEATREDVLLAPALVADVRAASKRLGASVVNVLLAAWNAYLYRLTGQTDFVVGMPAAGQAGAELPGLVGHCVNTLPLRAVLDPARPFAEHVKEARKAVLDGFEHQRLSFGALVKKLDLPRDPSRIPLIPVLFNLDKRIGPVRLGEAFAKVASVPRACESFEVFVNATETDDGILLETTYNTNLFERETVRRWLAGFEVLLAAAIARPETALGALPALTEPERRALLVDWNATSRPLPQVATALDLIERKAAETPSAIAVRGNRGAQSYAELDRHANFIAHRLRALGVGPESCVGVCVERGPAMVAALLGIWKAGAAYVPLDPEYPAGRLAFIAEDALLRALVTERALAEVLPASTAPRLWLDEERGERPDAPPRDLTRGSLAYVLHTSGSTGKPKGVLIEHEALLNFLVSMAQEPGMNARDVLVAVTTLSFDIAGLELYLPLTVGAQIVVATREEAMDGRRLMELLAASGATVLQATPATWRLLLEAGWNGSPSFRALCGGEAMPPDLARELSRRVGELWNVYGPTETTIWSTIERVRDPEAPISIGRPIANTTTYVVDAAGQPVPIGAFGELWLGGLGVARGYLNRPELTAERFVPDPFSDRPSARVYRTGDVVRFGEGGRLFFARRNDGQVKLRGFRIELGEVEAALARFPGVAASAAVVREVAPGDARLLGYYVPRAGASVSVSELRDHLRDAVPGYMVPQHLTELAALPLTPNGKVDRKALPTPAGGDSTGTYVAPVTEVQLELATLWSQLLGVHRVGLHDGFFELGGHSMLATRLLSRVRERFGIELPLRAIFQAQTLEALAARIEAALIARPASRPAGPVDEVEF